MPLPHNHMYSQDALESLHEEQTPLDLILDRQFTSTPRDVSQGNTMHIYSYYCNSQKYYGHFYSQTQNIYNNV